MDVLITMCDMITAPCGNLFSLLVRQQTLVLVTLFQAMFFSVLCNELHAKLFRSDACYLVSSD